MSAGHAALAAECTTDIATLERVIDTLRSQMAGVDPLSRHERLELPASYLERRTFTPLRQVRGAGR